MSYFNKQKEEQFKPIKIKSLQKHLRTTEQIGRSNVKVDAKLKALLPGKRISKTGNIYYEGRKNRSDAQGSKV